MLAERPADASGRAAVLVNGLGATKYEELFALFGDVAELLRAAGVVLVEPEVGELVTSLDMAGCSLSVTWLDEELEGYWVAPADTPAFRRGTRQASRAVHPRRTWSTDARETVADRGERGVRRRRGDRPRAVRALQRDRRGRTRTTSASSTRSPVTATTASACRAARRRPPRPPPETEGGVQTVLAAAGAAFGDKAGGTSGILWGLLLDGVGQGAGQHRAGHGRAAGRRRAAVRHRPEELQQGRAG